MDDTMNHDSQEPEPDRVEDNLRNRFAELRREESASLPSYTAIVQRPGAHTVSRMLPGWSWLWVPAIGAAALAIWLIALPLSAPEPSTTPVFTQARWTMPTDVLLITPGSELLRRAPAIGTESLLPAAPERSNSQRRMPG